MPDKGRREEEEVRLRASYQARTARQDDRRYDPLHPAGRWNYLETQRILLQALGRLTEDRDSLARLRILEVGCGRGGHLIRLAGLGVPPEQLSGIDLIPDRVAEARKLHSGIEFVLGSATALPWPEASFDVVLQMVCLSSVLDPDVRAAIAAEMRRVLRPNGAILSFDFTRNPVNRETIGIPLAELRRLFPGGRIEHTRVLLAPPLARRLAPLSWPLASLLSRVPWLCFHLIATIRFPS